ncbi:MAG TPA: hypothetical protein PLD47_08045, partial [Aggregatilineales bacterium]|nr:hypothetical protein [Aggregatilineales bacterium]
NALFGGRGDVGMVIAAAVEGEAVVSGRHVDNVAPAVIGGLVLVTGLEASQLFALPVPPTLWATICTPDVAVPTKEARAVLPREVSLATMVHQTGGLGLFIHALYRSDVALMGRAMMYDQV